MLQSLTNPDFGYFESTDMPKGFGVHSAHMLQQQQPAYAQSHKLAASESVAYEEPSSFFSSFLNSDFPIDVSFPVQTVPEAVPMMKAAYTSRVQAQAPIMQVAQQQQAPASPEPVVTKSKGTKTSSSKRKATTVTAPKDQPKTDVEAKRQKRRVKNREAAQLFRQRQKQHIRDLEQQVNGINNKNVELQTQMEVLRAENTLVKDQLKYLRCFVLEGLRSAFPEQKFKEMEAIIDGASLNTP